MTNTRMTDPEVVEWRFPVRVEDFSIRKHSGGQGRFSGGDGVIREIRFLEPMTATLLTSHRETEPYGISGGKAGKMGVNEVIRADGTTTRLLGNDEVFLSANDSVRIKTPGGGGYGNPEETDG
jgi:5-oxoprolinase (ATP-hydrolysing)